MKSVALSLLSIAAVGQGRGQSVDSLPDVEINEVKVLSARVPLTSAQTPQQVTIIGREEIAMLPVNTIDDLLKFAVGVDVRQRGNGVQTDICVRGGTFDQVTILLNGINITSPHTGHLSADFPISADDIERIEILEGPSARAFGTSAFTGTVNIVTRNVDPSRSRLGTAASGVVSLFGGDHGHAGANANVTLGHNAGTIDSNKNARLVHTLSGGYVRDDGDTPNSAYETSRIYYNVSYNSDNVKGNFQAGYSYKPFEANTFYGAASTDQWESNEHFVIAANGEITAGKIHSALGFEVGIALDVRTRIIQISERGHPQRGIYVGKQLPIDRRTEGDVHSRTETPLMVEGGIVDGGKRKGDSPLGKNEIVLRHQVDVGAVGGMIVIDIRNAVVSLSRKPRRLRHRLAEFGGIDEFAAHLGGE